MRPGSKGSKVRRVLKRGVTAGIPLRRDPAHRKEVIASVRKLPPCWIRADIVFWEVFLTPDSTAHTSDLEDIIEICIESGKKLMLNLTPVPHPSFQAWHTVTGGPWPEWFRPDFRLWHLCRQKAQWLIDFLSKRWLKLGGSKEGLRFEWFNEPGHGHVGGTSPKSGQATGVWDIAFHSFCNFMLVDEGHLDFRGHILEGATLSFFGEGAPERQELATAPGGDDGQWWSAIDRRAFNLAVYSKERVKTPERYAEIHAEELERVVGKMKALPVNAPKGPICIHEWYITKPMLGYHDGSCSDQFKADAIVAVGESIARNPDIELAFFFTHYFPPSEMKDEYGKHSAYSGPSRKALERFLRGKP